MLGLEPSDKRLANLLKEVLDSIKVFDRKIHFELMDTRKHAFRV